jgi:TRAP-type C4-dicarboxylate transport system substrate-binding protein
MKGIKNLINKRLWVIALVCVLFFWANPVNAETILKYGHANVPIYFYHTAGVAFGQCLENSSGGALKVKIYPQGQLGGERDITEGLQLGSVDLQATSIGVTGTFIPSLRILNLPFLFKGPKHWLAVMNGPVGQQILGKAREQGDQVGLKVLAIGAPDFRLPMNNKLPIKSIADFKGLKIRTMQVPIHMKAYEGIGASPVPLPFGELYTALQTGVVDGNENGPSATWDKLSHDHQLAVTKCISVWRKKMDQDAQEQGGIAIQKMKDQGLQVTTIDDVTPFAKATASAYEWLYNDLPKDTSGWTRSMVEKIREVGATIDKEEWYMTSK